MNTMDFMYTIGLKLSLFQNFNINFRFYLIVKLFSWYATKEYSDAILCFIHYSCMSMVRSSSADFVKKTSLTES